MNKVFILLVFTSLFFACNNKKNYPDISGIKASLNVKRFDTDFFGLDTNNVEASLNKLHEKYPVFLPLYLQNIVGVTSRDEVKGFYRSYKAVADSVQKAYADFTSVRTELELALRYVKYYFPSYKLPSSIITVVGPMNTMEDFARMENGDYSPDFIGDDFIGISLQFYLGKNFSLYNQEYFITNVAPLYRSRRFSREYIAADVMKLIAMDIFPDKSKGMPLVEQMIEKGKQWWLLDQFMPQTPDSVKTGYTRQQLEWCNANEGLIWSYIVKNENLNTIDPVTIQTYIGEAPFTQGWELSPGNIGQWIGWQIVKKFVEKNKGMKPEEIMQTSARKILEEAKYKPK